MDDSKEGYTRSFGLISDESLSGSKNKSDCGY